MIEMHVLNGVAIPMLVCDLCGEAITKAENGAAVFHSMYEDGERIKILHAHKNLDGYSCFDDAEKIVGCTHDRKPIWQEMRTHLLHLTESAGMTPKSMDAWGTLLNSGFEG